MRRALEDWVESGAILTGVEDNEKRERASGQGQYHPPSKERRCSASNRNGEHCMRWAIPGGTVCASHGGKAPQVRRKASLRLIELIDPAIATVARVMVDDTAKHSDRLRAAENVLDRAGVSRKTEIVTPEDARTVLTQRLIELRQERETAAVLDLSAAYPESEDDDE